MYNNTVIICVRKDNYNNNIYQLILTVTYVIHDRVPPNHWTYRNVDNFNINHINQNLL